VVSLPEIPYTPYIYGSGQPYLFYVMVPSRPVVAVVVGLAKYIYAVYDHIFGDLPAKIPYLYGSGQPYAVAVDWYKAAKVLLFSSGTLPVRTLKGRISIQL